MAVARSMSFKLAVIYEGLNFGRDPLPARTVGADLQMFLRRLRRRPGVQDLRQAPGRSGPAPGSSPPRTSSGSPGPCGVRSWCSPRRRARRAMHGWRTASTATRYYWSSVNPAANSGFPARLAGHERHGAPVRWPLGRAVRPGLRRPPGGRHQGGAASRRRHARQEYAAAVSSSPDALGLITLERVQREHARRAQPQERRPVPLRPLRPRQGRRGPGVAVGRGLQRGSGGRWRRPDRAARPRRVRRPPAARRRSPPTPAGTGPGRPLPPWCRTARRSRHGGASRATSRGAGSPRWAWSPAWSSPVPPSTGAPVSPGPDRRTPFYLGAQPVRAGGSVVVAAAGDIACPADRRLLDEERTRPRLPASTQLTAALLIVACAPDAVLPLGDNQYPAAA